MMADNKIRTARELRELASSVDQYPGLGDFAAAQVEPVLENLRRAQQAAHALASATQKIADHVDSTAKNAATLDAYTDSQPFTTLGRMVNVGAQARAGELAEIVAMISGNATALGPLFTAVQGAFGALTQEYNALANQVETLELPPAKEAPAQEDASTTTSTGEPGTQYVYE